MAMLHIYICASDTNTTTNSAALALYNAILFTATSTGVLGAVIGSTTTDAVAIYDSTTPTIKSTVLSISFPSTTLYEFQITITSPSTDTINWTVNIIPTYA